MDDEVVQTTFSDEHAELLLRLLSLATASPLETGELPQLDAAQRLYRDFAARIGFTTEFHGAPTRDDVEGVGLPVSVQDALSRFGNDFLASQPNLVLRLGHQTSRDRCLMFNVHLDTAGGEVPVGFDGQRFTGRGAVDAKGPAVALLAGLEAAYREHPELRNEITVLLQVVGGEEGGSMGMLGTRLLVDGGFFGGLNVFCEPTNHAYYTTATSSMTARIAVDGSSGIDDRPAAAHNATAILGTLIHRICGELFEDAARHGVKLCLAGVHTGHAHNRIYGTGQLFLNLAYGSMDAALALEAAVERVFASALEQFQRTSGDVVELERTTRDALEITSLVWMKRRLPVLTNQDQGLESMLQDQACIPPGTDPTDPWAALTCDAIWMSGKPGFAIIYGPGEVDRNGAHSPGEFIEALDLTRFAQKVKALLVAYAAKDRS